ncbi:MAG: hypothetical protein Q8K59_08320 [Nitrosomonas sp.]|nr:hypothetical protein [Nitrosomonas sp.]MDP1951080.1 hypothetical protein [Nitrosomonas sp.]
MPNDDLMLLVLENMKNSSKFKHELKLEGYPDDDVRSCVVYAIEKNLIEGELFRPISGAIEPLPQRLTAYGQDFIEQLHSKKRKTSSVKTIARWLKDHVLASVLIGSILAVISTILVFYTNQWMSPPQEKTHQSMPAAKAKTE